MNKQLQGIHHVTAITSSAQKIYDFFTNILGLRLVKKTVNQDDINTYHLFFADDTGSPGTDMTFFEFKGIGKAQHGTNEISRSGFRVATNEGLIYWKKRLNHFKINFSEQKVFGRQSLFFTDFDNQRYAIFSDEGIDGVGPGIPWKKGPVPNEYAIIGLGPIFLTVDRLEIMKAMLVDVLKMQFISSEGSYHLFHMGKGGNGGSVIVVENLILPLAKQGYGTVHHVAFRVNNHDELEVWRKYFNQIGAVNSGHVDRFYFESVYTRIYRNILFELATDEPGFIDDEESYEILGEKLALPPRFRDQREYVESIVKHIDTVRSNKEFKKEYFE